MRKPLLLWVKSAYSFSWGTDLPESLVEEALNYAHILTKKSRVALRIAKKALNGIEPFDVDANYRWEQGFTYEMYLHEDSQKARDAFVETGNLADYRKK